MYRPSVLHFITDEVTPYPVEGRFSFYYTFYVTPWYTICLNQGQEDSVAYLQGFRKVWVGTFVDFGVSLTVYIFRHLDEGNLFLVKVRSSCPDTVQGVPSVYGVDLLFLLFSVTGVRTYEDSIVVPEPSLSNRDTFHWVDNL